MGSAEPEAVPEGTPGGSLGLPPVGAGSDGATAAVIPAAITADTSGDCRPKCAVLGRENNESPEPVLAMAPAM